MILLSSQVHIVAFNVRVLWSRTCTWHTQPRLVSQRHHRHHHPTSSSRNTTTTRERRDNTHTYTERLPHNHVSSADSVLPPSGLWQTTMTTTDLLLQLRDKQYVHMYIEVYTCKVCTHAKEMYTCVYTRTYSCEHIHNKDNLSGNTTNIRQTTCNKNVHMHVHECVHVCICTHACTHVHMHVYIYVYVHMQQIMCTHKCVHVWMCTHACTWMCTCMYMYTYIVHMYTCMYTCTHACVHVCICTHACTHVHMHVYMYAYILQIMCTHATNHVYT